MNSKQWSNWSGNVTCTPAAVWSPPDEQTLSTFLQASTGPVRIAGEGHSFVPLCATTGTLLTVDAWQGLVSADCERCQATVRAGTRLWQLGPVLHEVGLGLANMGDIDRQSLAGAVSTGTHGTGQTLGNFATQVVGLRLILASGEVVECSAEQHPALFAAARLGLGALGVLAQITVQALPAYQLHERTWVTAFDDCLEQLPTLIAGHRHFEFFWSPGEDACAMKALSTVNSRPDEQAKVPPPPAIGRLSRYMKPERTDWSYRIFPSERNNRFNELEFAVPAEAGPDCLRALRHLMQTRFPDVLWPLEYRTVQADEIPLSPAYGRPTVTISVHQDATLPYQEFFTAAEAIFRDYQGRPHWGKWHQCTARDLQEQYPRWDEFVTTREQVDPQGRFLSPYLQTLFNQ